MARTKNGFGIVSNDVMRNPNIPLKLKGLYEYNHFAIQSTENPFEQ